MILIATALLLQAAPALPGRDALLVPTRTSDATTSSPAGDDDRYAHCVGLIDGDAAKAQAYADTWQADGGGVLARLCRGGAYGHLGQWTAAASEFEAAARAAEAAHDPHAATAWVQAGNAQLIAGRPAPARRDFDAALATGQLTGGALGEARLDRARAAVATGDLTGARSDIDAALTTASDDPLAWLLSATLARRMGDLGRATTDIRRALDLSPDDASVHLEAGNIAASEGDADGAKAAWAAAIKASPDSPQAASARVALQQFASTPVSR